MSADGGALSGAHSLVASTRFEDSQLRAMWAVAVMLWHSVTMLVMVVYEALMRQSSQAVFDWADFLMRGRTTTI